MTEWERAAGPGAEPNIETPDFPVAMRGYDRQRVDVFIEGLRSLLADERQRAKENAAGYAQLQQEVATLKRQEPPSFEHLGAESARVLEQAGHGARVLLQEAQAKCDALVQEAKDAAAQVGQHATQQAAQVEAAARKTIDDATTERDRILARAEEAAERLRVQVEEEAHKALEQARKEMTRVRKESENERLALEAEIARLRTARDQIRDQLGRVHADVGELLGGAVSANPEGSARPEQPSQAPNPPAAEQAKPAQVEAAGELETKKDVPAGNRADGR
jgi:cell division septum initiation protein DivIVA